MCCADCEISFHGANATSWFKYCGLFPEMREAHSVCLSACLVTGAAIFHGSEAVKADLLSPYISSLHSCVLARNNASLAGSAQRNQFESATFWLRLLLEQHNCHVKLVCAVWLTRYLSCYFPDEGLKVYRPAARRINTTVMKLLTMHRAAQAAGVPSMPASDSSRLSMLHA